MPNDLRFSLRNVNLLTDYLAMGIKANHVSGFIHYNMQKRRKAGRTRDENRR